jgi:hypothetical protein
MCAALILFYQVRTAEVLMMTFANYIIYECGYYINDKSDKEDAHKDRTRLITGISNAWFWSAHVALFFIIAICLSMMLGMTVVIYFTALTLCVLFVMIWHTSRTPKNYNYTRIFSFACLQIYKYSPVILSLIGVNRGIPLMIAIFLCWGAWRTVAYILLKFSVPREVTSRDIDQNRLLHTFSMIIVSPLFLAMITCYKCRGLIMVWGIYACLSVLRSGFQMTKWKIAWK